MVLYCLCKECWLNTVLDQGEHSHRVYSLDRIKVIILIKELKMWVHYIQSHYLEYPKAKVLS